MILSKKTGWNNHSQNKKVAFFFKLHLSLNLTVIEMQLNEMKAIPLIAKL